MKRTYAEKRFFKWELDDVSVSLRAKSGSYGGGSEVLVVQMVLASIAPNAERTDGTISPTIMHRAGTGGGQLPILIMREEENELSERDRLFKQRGASR